MFIDHISPQLIPYYKIFATRKRKRRREMKKAKRKPNEQKDYNIISYLNIISINPY